MTLGDLGNIGELVGGIAVVVSLLYLAVQIRHSIRISRFEAHRALSIEMTTVFKMIASDPDLYRIWKLMTGPFETASEDDRERFGMLLYRVFTTFSDAERFGQMDAELLQRSQTYLDRFLYFPSVRGWWERQGENFSPHFQAVVAERLKTIEAAT